MFYKGSYNFFDYKYNIIGYNGEDFGGFPQKFYLIISFLLIAVLLFSLRKISKDKVLKIIRFMGIFLVLFYILKTTWESYFDIKLGGAFNWWLLPFDTCSIIMTACLVSGFGKGKIKQMADSWLATGAIVGGIAAMIFLNAFKYYPFFSFGAFYSMIWHLLMVFIGLLVIVTGYVEINYKTILNGFAFHFLISLIVIPINYIWNFDFMMYRDLGGIPIFEDIATKFANNGLYFLNPVMMLTLYFIAFNIVFAIPLLIHSIRSRKKLSLENIVI